MGETGKKEWASEVRQERLELQEMRENLWRWREKGGGKTRTGKEKMPEPNKKTNDKKLKKLEEILLREKQDKKRCEEIKERERQEYTNAAEKKKNKLEMKKALENKWQTIRWVNKILEDNEKELGEMLIDLKEKEMKDLKDWEKLARFEKIEKLRNEKGFTRENRQEKEIEIDDQSAWEKSRKFMKKKKSTPKKIFTTPTQRFEKGTSSAKRPGGGEGGGGRKNKETKDVYKGNTLPKEGEKIKKNLISLTLQGLVM